MASVMKEMDIDYLRGCLEYDQDSGALIWRTRPRQHFDSDRGWRNFNSRWAGKQAGTVSETTGYVFINFNGILYPGHRIAFALHHGDWPDGHIDHVNGQRADNRMENLRVCSRSQNQMNRPKQRNNTSGFKGVTRHVDGRWRACIKAGPKRHHIGLFDSPQEAHAAYLAAAERIHGEFANAQ